MNTSMSCNKRKVEVQLDPNIRESTGQTSTIKTKNINQELDAFPALIFEGMTFISRARVETNAYVCRKHADSDPFNAS